MTASRIIVTVLTFITGYLVSTFVLMLALPIPKVLVNHSNLVSALLAIVLSVIALKGTAHIREQLLNSILIGGVIGGGICFVLTLVGAMILYPGCNICPVMSIFFAPIGFFLGLAGGWLVWKKRTANTAK